MCKGLARQLWLYSSYIIARSTTNVLQVGCWCISSCARVHIVFASSCKWAMCTCAPGACCGSCVKAAFHVGNGAHDTEIKGDFKLTCWQAECVCCPTGAKECLSAAFTGL